MSGHRILFIDAYDSFSNNIISLLESEAPVSVETIKIDDTRFVLNDDAFHTFLDGFDAVVAGPGPGHPGDPADVGLIAKLWSLPNDHLLPVLGICLGLQSLALAYGATVERLDEPRHGLVTPVSHCGRDIFANTGEVLATQYHSLHVCLNPRKAKAHTFEPWKPSRSCPKLLPLAWDVSDALNGPILMGARHSHKPFWGVQYHPESICTNGEGQRLIQNWWRMASKFRSRRFSLNHGSGIRLHPRSQIREQHSGPSNDSSERRVHWKEVQLPDASDVVHIVDMLRADCAGYDPILLESSMRNGAPVNSETGRFSIIGLHDVDSDQIRYSTSNHRLETVTRGTTMSSQAADISTVFSFLEDFMGQHSAVGGPANVPFWGGLMGFVSYEAGLESIDVAPAAGKEDRPDVWFVFVKRSIVVDHIANIAYVESVSENDEEWLSSCEEKLRALNKNVRCKSPDSRGLNDSAKIFSSPKKDDYCNQVLDCQDHLRAGSSYELCLTDQTLLRTEEDSWSLYTRLRRLNPAPFGAYLNFTLASSENSASGHGVSLISSSPERFLSWSRDGECQFRPIKGTVKKGPGMDLAKARGILGSAKERAENLMIVDLIRHDLSGVPSVRDVRVPKLMSIEEYETVYQLVSVIEGNLDKGSSGISVLAKSLPPGSMTGAPKKRSCELLKKIEENKPRGLYSGVVGYLDVGGGGDFSVVIRSAFKYHGEGEDWRVGAGGAVTVLSEAEAEWEEMLAKREGILKAFCT